ncbi:hypothetical protein J2Y58_003108 [Sphingomonas sp. BE138]|uniref:autotransporter outer membrane beta-barrel domain-containing protein n=1 Tax=Sphingomonas sp. BE138 TaxID=2817845 RepID=UPI00285D91C4|nr:autotransporter outer membrane beta-barrel domain-containing protein [Sphingomonas sp. BE138]MDR6789733.1 hypothetical protein [Sphingomonas sp. BE138]
MAVQRSVRLRRWSLALGTSIAAMGVASSAQAQCSPDPVTSFNTTTCTGTDNDGLIADAFAARVVVAEGATVRGGFFAPIDTRSQSATFTINGTVDGDSRIGFLVSNGQPYQAPCDPYAGASVIVCPPGLQTYYPSARADITVGAAGRITGGQGLVSRRLSSNSSGEITVTLTNEGTIAGTSGAAIRDASTVLTVSNKAGGTIRGVGTAIDTDGTLRLVNAGAIEGSVISRTTGSTNDGSSIDTLAGTITGDLTLGAGNDTLAARYEAGRIVTGISGAIDGGAGIDTLDMRLATSADFATLPLLTGFERLSLRMSDAPVVAIGTAGGVIDGALALGGDGTVTINGTLTGTGQVLTAASFDGAPTIVNAGTIQGTSGGANTYLVRISDAKRFQNDGLIDAAGNGVSINAQGMFVNAGTLQASGTALDLWGSGFTNTGTIRSTAGVGAIMNGSSGTNWSNSGTIEGAIAAVRLSSDLANTGLITSPGLAVDLGYYGVLSNRAGGRIVGNIGPQVSGTGLFNAVVANAGTITGNVSFGGSNNSSYSSNRYFALAGGVLDGNLTLGRNEMLVTSLTGEGSSGFAGINGAVFATDALLRYRVDVDTTVSAIARLGFAEVGYDLINNAGLTLTGATTPLAFAGNGSVDLTADIAATTQAAISVSNVTIAPGETRPDRESVSITSYGTLTLDRSGGNANAFAAVRIGGDHRFTNAGTIVVRGLGGQGFVTGIYSDFQGEVTNNGTITLDGATGIGGAATVTNTGRIVQVEGGRTATGIATFGTLDLTNSGTITVAGTAVDTTRLTLDNSGTITSTDARAIGGNDLPYATITNRAGATISGSGTAIRMASGSLNNAGAIIGSVDMLYGGATYVAQGGTLTGDLRLNNGANTLVVYDGVTGVSGTIYADGANDTYVDARTTNATVTLGNPLPAAFEREGVRAVGTDTVITLTGTADTLNLSGTGAFVNTVTTANGATTGDAYSRVDDREVPILTSFTNQADIRGGFSGQTRQFVNAAGATIKTNISPGTAVDIRQLAAIDFLNDGTIGNDPDSAAAIFSRTAITATNRGTIDGSLDLDVQGSAMAPTAGPVSIALTNTGRITGAQYRDQVQMTAFDGANVGASLTLDNRGSIVSSTSGDTAVYLATYSSQPSSGMSQAVRTINVTNSGTIRANAGGRVDEYYDFFTGQTVSYPRPATALSLHADTVSVANADGGTIEATGDLSVAVTTSGALDLTNAGTIRGGAGATYNGFYYAGAILTGDAADRITNTGTIIGSIGTGAGDDRIENYGTLDGNVFLGDGDDTFLHRASATLTGTVDAGLGTDSLIIDASAGGTVRAAQFINFERFSQIGNGAVDYVGAFQASTIGVAGGTVTVGAGETLSSAGAVTITGTDAAETVDNAGTITGAVDLDAGNDTFVERAGSSVAGGVDGGAGVDTYRVALSGDRSGLGTRSGFEQLSITGTGTLALTLDQRFDNVALAGTGLALTLNGNTIGAVTGSDAAETLGVDGDVARVALGGGNDTLALGTTTAAGSYAGGAGSDTLRFTSTAPVTLAGVATGFETLALAGNNLIVAGTLGASGDAITLGDGAQTLVVAEGGTVGGTLDMGAGDDTLAFASAIAAGRFTGGAGSDMLRFTSTAPVTLAGNVSGFETIALAGNALTVTGTLGAAGETATLGDGAQALTLGNGGTIAGTIDLGAGNDSFSLAPGGTLSGTVAGGAGDDIASVGVAGTRTLDAASLTGFETLASTGTGTLTLTGAQSYRQVLAGTDLTIAGTGSLTTQTLRMAGGNERLTIAGGFAGAVDGGAGTDTVAVSGGSSSVPVAFTDVGNVDAFGMSGGYATVSGNAALGTVALTGGRLVGLANSTLSASRFDVGSGATFGSAGIVNGNVTVAGTLSPGASPGTMTVNGNVSLASGSLSVFELTPTVSDRLVVNGALQIASGATLQIVPVGTLRAGTSYDLITASGGITGGFTTVSKPASLFGVIVQRADRIQLLGQFLTDARFSPQVARSVAYANATLAVQPATSALFGSLPALVDASGASNARAFAQLTPEAYASATQLGIDHALSLTQVARGNAFATDRAEAGAFTVAQTIGQWHTLQGDAAQGSSTARAQSYGFLGGVGYGDRGWMVGAFGGYLNGRQQIGALGARTKASGVVAGVHGRYGADSGWGFSASVLYDGGKARTDRALPGTVAATGRYDLHSWVSDIAAHYGIDAGDGWSLRPRVGVTYIRTTRDGVAERGGSAFALQVARDVHVAGFADAGLTLARSEASDAPFRPFVTLGARYQIEGQRADALAGYAGGGLGLSAVGAARGELVGTAAGGVAYRLPGGLDLYASASAQTGRDDHQETITAGVRLRF